MLRRLAVALAATLALTADAAAQTATPIRIGADVNDTGRAAVAWSVGGYEGTVGMRVAVGDASALGAPARLSDDESSSASAVTARPKVFVAADGSVRVVWRAGVVDYSDPQPRLRWVVRAARVDASGSVTSVRDLSPRLDEEPVWDAAGNAAGETVVAWGGGAPGAVLAGPGGDPARVDLPAYGSPAVAIDGDGNIATAGSTCAGACPVQLTERSAAGVMSAPVAIPGAYGVLALALPGPGRARAVISTATGPALTAASDGTFAGAAPLGAADPFLPAVKLDVADDGAGHVVWASPDGIATAPVAANGGVAPSKLLSTDASAVPDLAVAGDGRAIASAPVAAAGVLSLAEPGGVFGPPVAFAPSSDTAVAVSRSTRLVAWVANVTFPTTAAYVATVGADGVEQRRVIGEAELRRVEGDTSTVDPPAQQPAVRGGRAGVPAGVTRILRRGVRVRVPILCWTVDRCRGRVRAGRGAARFALERAVGRWVWLPARFDRRGRVRVRVGAARPIRLRTTRRDPPCVIEPWAGLYERLGTATLFAVRRPRGEDEWTTTTYACATAAARRRVLLREEQGFMDEAGVDSARLGEGWAVLAGSRGGRYGMGSSWLRTVRLDGTGATDYEVGTYGMSPQLDVRLLRARVTSGGTAVIVDVANGRVRIRALGPAGDRVLDPGPEIDPASLSVQGRTVRWYRGRQLQQAVLP